jgi:hypothetical protein
MSSFLLQTRQQTTKKTNAELSSVKTAFFAAIVALFAGMTAFLRRREDELSFAF